MGEAEQPGRIKLYLAHHVDDLVSAAILVRAWRRPVATLTYRWHIENRIRPGNTALP